MVMVAVYDVALAVAAIVIVCIDFPYDFFGILVIQRKVWIDARVYENAMLIDMHQRQPFYPIQMWCGHDCYIRPITFRLSIGDQRCGAAVREPPIDIRQPAARLPHDVFMVAFEAD
jgi:hypothetical protein